MKVKRSTFVNNYKNKEISLEQIQQDRHITSDVKRSFQRADLNRDGAIKGTSEADRLFTELDSHDRNGDRNSVRLTDRRGRKLKVAKAIEAADRALTTPGNTSTQPSNQPRRVTREAFKAKHSDQPISVPKTQRDPQLSSSVKRDFRRADLNRDNQIKGNRELDRLFTNLDRHDRNGDRNSINVTDSRGRDMRIAKAFDAAERATVETGSVNNGNATNPAGMGRVRGMENTSQAFRDKAAGIAQRLGMDPTHLMAVMSFESSETFSPSIRNAAGSGATGLIQFMPRTARGLGTSTDELARMTPERQLDYVERYLSPYRGRLNSVEDAYMAVLYPAAIGKGSNHTLFRRGTTAYRQNRGLDSNGNGLITVHEAAAKVRAKIL